MKVIIGSDHAGFALKECLKVYLQGQGHTVLDLGTDTEAPVDYPDFARAVAETLVRGRGERGIIICGSGVGANIAANKVPGIRAAICHDCYSAHQGVEHDDMNTLVLGSRVIGEELAKELVKAFLGAGFSGEERHVRRLNKVLSIEKTYTLTGD
nr:ribose 5-phosphate isomerase B [Anaerolineae bacterium]